MVGLPRDLDFARFRAIADEVGALLTVDMAHFAPDRRCNPEATSPGLQGGPLEDVIAGKAVPGQN
jgi:glycine/serine hydroxymethyltransferase